MGHCRSTLALGLQFRPSLHLTPPSQPTPSSVQHLLYLRTQSAFHSTFGSRSSASPTMAPPPSSLTIPVLLLKTRSQPHDAYEECLFGSRSTTISRGDDTRAEESTAFFLP